MKAGGLDSALSMADLRKREHVANKAPPKRHIAPPPRANNALNQPVFKHTLPGSALGSSETNKLLLKQESLKYVGKLSGKFYLLEGSE